MQAAATIEADPAAPLFRRFRSAAGEHLLIVPHTRLFDLPPALAEGFDAGSDDAGRLVAMLGEPSPQEGSAAHKRRP
jgi:uncharacterized protein